jgi:hypothetical protein
MYYHQQNWGTRGQNRFCLEVGVGEVAQTMYTHLSKCKNDKMKKERGGKKEESFQGLDI